MIFVSTIPYSHSFLSSFGLKEFFSQGYNTTVFIGINPTPAFLDFLIVQARI